MKKIFLGSSPLSSVAGYVMAGLVVVNEMFTHGETNWRKIGIGAVMAILGRIVADSKDTKDKGGTA